MENRNYPKRTGIHAENLYGRERTEFPDAETDDVRDRRYGNRYGRVRQRSGQSFGHVHGDGRPSPRGQHDERVVDTYA